MAGVNRGDVVLAAAPGDYGKPSKSKTGVGSYLLAGYRTFEWRPLWRESC